MDMMKMMKQAASLQKEMKKKQKELSRMKMTHEEAGVRIDISGELKILQVSMDPDLIQSGDVKRIEKTVEVALQGAVDLAQKKVSEQMSSLTAGMGLPGNMKLPF
jgi:DNA-binding YbaB/EbfC family protein